MSTTTIIVIATIFLVDLMIFGGLWIAAAKSRSNRPEEVGGGRIGSGSGKPNYVSSLEGESANSQIEPLIFYSDSEAAWKAAVDSVGALEKSEIITNTGRYLHAEVRSAFFNFVDDLELQLVPEEKKIHMKSASRVGHSDFGANRTRAEKLRAKFERRSTE